MLQATPLPMLSSLEQYPSPYYRQQSEDLTPPAMFQPLSTLARHANGFDAEYDVDVNNASPAIDSDIVAVAAALDGSNSVYEQVQHSQAMSMATLSDSDPLMVAWPSAEATDWYSSETSSRLHAAQESLLPDALSPPPGNEAYAEPASELDSLANTAILPLRLADSYGGPMRSLRSYAAGRRFVSNPDPPSYRIQALYNQSQGLDSGNNGGGGGGTRSGLSSLVGTPMSVVDGMVDSPADTSAYGSENGHDAYHFGQLMQAASAHVSGAHPSNAGGSRPAGRRSSSISPVHQAYKSKQRKRNKCTPVQKEMLESFFARNRNPIGEIRERLAKDLDMPERSVQIWFQNKRAKVKAADMGLSPIPAKAQRPNRSQSAGEMQHRNGRNARSSQEPTIIQFPASALTIGSWRRISPLSCYFSKRLQMLTWYIRNNSIGFKLDLPSTYIRSIHLEGPRNPTPCEEAEGLREPVGDLVVQVSRPPTFFMEVFKSAGDADGRNDPNESLSHAWRQCADFTEGRQATSEEVHYISGPYWGMRAQMLEVKHLGGDIANLIDVEGMQEDEDDDDLVDHDGNDSDFFTSSEPPSFAPQSMQNNMSVQYGAPPFDQSSTYMTTQLHPSQPSSSSLNHSQHTSQSQGLHQFPVQQQNWHAGLPMGGEHHSSSSGGSGPGHHTHHAAISLHQDRASFLSAPQRSFTYSDPSSAPQNPGGSASFGMYDSYPGYSGSTGAMSAASPSSRTFASSLGMSQHPQGQHQHLNHQSQQQASSSQSYLSGSAPPYDLNTQTNLHLHEPQNSRVSMTGSLRMDAPGPHDIYGAMQGSTYEPKYEHVAHLDALPAVQQTQQAGQSAVPSPNNISAAAAAQETAAAQLPTGWGSSYDVITHIDPALHGSDASGAPSVTGPTISTEGHADPEAHPASEATVVAQDDQEQYAEPASDDTVKLEPSESNAKHVEKAVAQAQALEAGVEVIGAAVKEEIV